MILVVLLMVGGSFVVLLARRRSNKATLAGLNSVKPTFTVEPPHRRMGSRRTEFL